MDARIARFALLACCVLCLGANHRSQNFVVSAPTKQFARQVCDAAETYRRDLAIEWLGQELPPWRGPCPIQVQVGPQLGAGGATSFMFDRRGPYGWTMSIQGSAERLIDSVLPHEVTHTIFATHFRRPLPRWADEGACTTVEHESERRKQDYLLVRFLTQKPVSRGIPFNQLFAMRDYPSDIMPLYSQGYSLAKFLIQQGGKRKFVDYVGDGMETNDWTWATKKHYGFESLSQLQLTWNRWVAQGSPQLSDLASVTQPALPTASTASVVQPLVPVASPETSPASTAGDDTGSWYARVANQNKRASASRVYRAPASPLKQMLERRSEARSSLH